MYIDGCDAGVMTDPMDVLSHVSPREQRVRQVGGNEAGAKPGKGKAASGSGNSATATDPKEEAADELFQLSWVCSSTSSEEQRTREIHVGATKPPLAGGAAAADDKRGVIKCEFTVGEPSNPSFSIVGGKGSVESGGAKAVRVLCTVPEGSTVGSRLRGTVEVVTTVQSLRRTFVVELVAEVASAS